MIRLSPKMMLWEGAGRGCEGIDRVDGRSILQEAIQGESGKSSSVERKVLNERESLYPSIG